MMDELFFSKEKLLKMYKLKNIMRYNHKTRLKDESVAEHSFFTTLITLELCKRFKLDNESMLACLLKSLLHDMPETELNDITYDVKVALNLYPLLKVYEDKYFEKYFPELATLLNDESENAVNLIVKYADATSVLQYAYNEIELGNATFEAIKDETLERLKILEQKLSKIIRRQ